MLNRRSFVAATLAVAAPPAAAQTSGQAAPWPSKPIKLVVPYAPGGTTDVVARRVAEYLGQKLGQNIIVDNKPGKDAMVGTAIVAKAAPDGYTLLMSVISGLSISPTLYGGGDFDPMGDFIHVSIASTNPSVLVANPNFQTKTFKELIDYAKADPGKVSYATSAAPHIKAGKVNALAVSGETRSPAFPDVPTMKELGYSDLISYSWFGISVPAKTPQPIVDRLATEMQAVLKEPAVTKRWEEIGAAGSTMTPAEVTRFIQGEIDKWTPVVKASGAKPG